MTLKTRNDNSKNPVSNVWLNPESNRIMEELYAEFYSAIPRRHIFRESVKQYAKQKSFPASKVYPYIGRRPSGTIAMDEATARAFKSVKAKTGYSNNAIAQFALQHYQQTKGEKK